MGRRKRTKAVGIVWKRVPREKADRWKDRHITNFHPRDYKSVSKPVALREKCGKNTINKKGGEYECMEKRQIKLVCFVCEWNEGRSVHLEMSVRLKLKRHGSNIEVISAGFSQADTVNPLRKAFLLGLGVPAVEIDSHFSTIFNEKHAQADLVLVAELPMKERLLKHWPELARKVMTVKGFIKGMSPLNEDISEEEAKMEDAGGKDMNKKLELYVNHEQLAEGIAQRLIDIEAGRLSFP